MAATEGDSVWADVTVAEHVICVLSHSVQSCQFGRRISNTDKKDGNQGVETPCVSGKSFIVIQRLNDFPNTATRLSRRSAEQHVLYESGGGGGGRGVMDESVDITHKLLRNQMHRYVRRRRDFFLTFKRVISYSITICILLYDYFYETE